MDFQDNDNNIQELMNIFQVESEEILDKMGFNITLSCTDGINFITENSSLKLLKRFNRPHGISVEKLLKMGMQK